MNDWYREQEFPNGVNYCDPFMPTIREIQDMLVEGERLISLGDGWQNYNPFGE